MGMKTKAASAAVGTLLLFGGVAASPVGAQETETTTETEDDGFDDWGLLGLLGLVGLAGLAGRKRDGANRSPNR